MCIIKLQTITIRHSRVHVWTGAHCPQDVSLNHVFHPLQMPHNVTSEDCLYLNVYTSSLSGEMPVFVWIHGGGFVFGNGMLTRLGYNVMIAELNGHIYPGRRNNLGMGG